MVAAKFRHACIATPHHLASDAGASVLASGGNALDAAVAANLVLGVVTPYLCGFGGDLFAMIWRDGIEGYNGSGRAPAAASPESIRRATGAAEMPIRGVHSVTVPGAVEAWFRLLERFGTRSFAELATPALSYARQGFEVSARAAVSFANARAVYGVDSAWGRVYADTTEGATLRQEGLARTIETLSNAGASVYYQGPIADAIVRTLQSDGSVMTKSDLAQHSGAWVRPMSLAYHGFEVLEMPPNTQGVSALEALGIADEIRVSDVRGTNRHHLMIEAVKVALSDRAEYVGDPAAMPVAGERLIDREFLRARASTIDPNRAGAPMPGRAFPGGTAYLCATDAGGMCVSLIQSNFMGFGSGVHVEDWGINLHNRGGRFSLDPSQVDSIGPRKLPLHTLIPGFVLREGKPWLVFGTMGGDGQLQTQLQLLTQILDDGADPQDAIDAPRWFVDPSDWTVFAEPGLGEIAAGLASMGHVVRTVETFDSLMGHAHAIAIGPEGYAGATDPRAEGAVRGI